MNNEFDSRLNFDDISIDFLSKSFDRNNNLINFENNYISESSLRFLELSSLLEESTQHYEYQKYQSSLKSQGKKDSDINTRQDILTGSNNSELIQDSALSPFDNLAAAVEGFWSKYFADTQLEIDLEFGELPRGQLAEAKITDFNNTGFPSKGTIVIDRDADGVGWFIDETPLDHSEFEVQEVDHYLVARENSEAEGKYDLLTTIFHETIHLYGFIEGYSGFDERISEPANQSSVLNSSPVLSNRNEVSYFTGDDFTATLQGEHLDADAHPDDLLNPNLIPGIRKLPSELDIKILQQLLLSKNSSEVTTDIDLSAALTAGLGVILNGDFSIAEQADANFGWELNGGSKIENGQAVLTENSPFLSNFTQTFAVPEAAKTLQFKLVEIELVTNELAPPDVFEVALLDSKTNQSLTSDSGLTETDSLLNIQNDGTAYFSDKVRIGGASSGEIIDLDKSRTVTVDISHLAAGTEATLYFDLLGFGEVDSRVVIDDVRLSDQNLLLPVAADDTANTTQGQAVEIDILANDTDDDGVIAPNSVQIQTEPINGSVIPRLDGTVSYLPDQRFAGTDSFTYVVQDNDGQFSEPATVEVTVDNVAPEITEIQIPSITEGVEFTLNAVATDAGSDLLTYSWELDSQQLSDNNQQINYTFPDNGTYTGSVTVSDPYGGTDTKAFEVVVNNAAPVVDAGGDVAIDEGSSVELSGSYSDTGVNDTHTVTWDFGDQSTVNSNQSTVEHIYVDDGEYTATYTVTDNDGAVGSDTVEVTVNNVAPIIESLTGDTEVNEGDTVTFNAIASDPGDDTLTYVWDFGDGSEQLSVNSNQLPVSHVYVDNGDYTVTLTVRDEDGGETAQTLDVRVNNVAPTFDAVNGATEVNEGEVVDYSALATDPGDDELTYSWNFGDDTPEVTGADVTHTFIQNGTYDATVTVTDDDGASTASNLTITVNNVAPTLDTESTVTGEEGSAVSFEATFDDPGNDDLSVTWDFGDGSDTVTSNYPAASEISSETQIHTYADNGIYTATVTITDSDGAITTRGIEVTVVNTAPVIDSLTGDTEINEGDTATFNAIASDAGNDELTYTWDFGDGSQQLTVNSQQSTVEHIYTDNGEYTVTLTVRDEDAGLTSSELTITVNNVAPAIATSEDLAGNEGQPVEFDFNFSDPGILDTHTVVWDFGDGNQSTVDSDAEQSGANPLGQQSTVTHTYSDNGVYIATLTVTDNDGATSSQEVTVTVNNVPPAFTEVNGSTEVNEGEVVNYNAIATDPGDDELTYTWSFDGGTTQVDLADVNHVFAQDGTYDATVTATDDDGASTTETLNVTVNNVAPSIETDASKTGEEGSAVEFNATISDPGTDALIITWDFGDGSELVTTDYSESPTPYKATTSHTYTQNGTYTATVTVTDSDGGTTSSEIEVSVNNVAPVIESLIGDTEINEGDTATFNAIATDPGDDELTYSLDFGDGSEQVTGVDPSSVTHTYTDNGDYTVTLTVRDEDGAEAVQTHQIAVNNTVPVITNLTGDPRVDEGDIANFSVSASDAGEDTLTYVWDFGDGSDIVMGENVEHIFADNGLYETTVTVTDDDGAAATQSLTITVDNVAPIADPWLDEESIEGDSVEFNVNFSDPGVLDTHTLTWDFGDGSEQLTTDGSQRSLSHVYSDNGVYTASVVITDKDGASSTNTMTVTVNNAAPTIDSLTGDTEIDEGSAANFAVAASDPGADELTYTWDFGDGLTATGTDVAHTFTQNGTYTVTVTVTDDDGASTSSTLEVTVNNVAPTIESLTGDTAVDEGTPATFNAIATDPGDDELTYTWDFGDGSEQLSVNSEQLPVSHTYNDDGEYTVTLTVTDPDGASTSQSLGVTINNVDPVITEINGDRNIDEGGRASFNASATDAGDDELTYTWDLGNGNLVTGQSVEDVYLDNGVYEVTLTVSDGDGGTASSNLTITVDNVAPAIAPIADRSSDEGQGVVFDFSFSDPGILDTHTVVWDFGDGTQPQALDSDATSVSHTYTDNGEYTATLTVTDNDGASTTETAVVTVSNVAPTFTQVNGRTNVNEGEVVNYSATATDPGDDELTYTWSFNNGASEVEQADVNHIFAQDGNYDAIVTVTDDDGASTSSTLEVTVNNVAPSIDTDNNQTGNEGSSVEFAAAFSDPGTDILTITWDFGDGTESVTTNYDDSPTPFELTQAHIYAQDGIYNATVTVNDSDGAITQSTVEVTINNVAPTIESLNGDTDINEGDTAIFNAIATDPGADELTYSWDFGDGTDPMVLVNDSSPVSHTYTDNGEYTVTLTVTDPSGASDTQSLEVTVNNVAPTITEALGDTPIDEGGTANFNATATDPGDDTLTYTWSFPDGAELTGEAVNKSFVEDGEYNVDLTVSDEDGAVTSQSLTITVNNVAPTIEAIADRIADEGSAIAFHAAYSDPGVLDTHTIEWDFGDGSTATDTLSPTHTYTDNGEYDVNLTITDDEGAATTVDFTVTVNNVAPVITELTSDTNINEGDTASFRAIASDPGNDELTYTWNFGDGSEVVSGQDVDHIYADDGNYDVTLTVTDDDGDSTNQSFAVLVDNVAPTIIDITTESTITDNQVTTLSANATDPGEDTLTYTWDLGDGNRLQGQSIEHIYEFAGNYTITLTVRDDDGAEVRETREIFVEPTVRANLQFVQNRLKSQIFLDGVKVEEIKGRQNQPVSTDFERIIVSAIDSPDVPNAKADLTFLDNGEGIGVTDGDDYNSSSKKRIDRDEALLIEINPTADYNSANVASFILDRLKSGAANGGVVKVVALLENEVVGEESFNLDNYRDTFTFTNDIPFNSLQLRAADNDTKFTFREVELATTKYRLPIRDNLRLEQNGLDLTVYENGVEIEAIAGIANQPLVDSFDRIDITAINGDIDSQVLVDHAGFGIGDRLLDANETLTLALQPTSNYNAANNLMLEFSEATTPGSIELTFLRGGLVVQEAAATIKENIGKVEVPSNLPFDTVQIKSAADTSFSINAVEFATIQADNRFSQLTFYQDQLESKIFENGYLVEQYSGKQNQPLTDTMSRLSLDVVDSNDGSRPKVDRTFLDRGEGIGITDGEDGNSSRKKRIDRDEVLEVAINSTINYNSATSAVVTVDKVKAISGNSQGGVVKLAAYWQGDLVAEESFNLAAGKSKITLDSDAPFDKLAVMAGDNNTQFTLRVAQFTTASTWIESLTVNEGELVNFSVPSDIKAQEFNWDLGEGTTKSGKQISHRFEDNGDYLVTLTATDAAGVITNRITNVKVNNLAPTITEINGERTIDLGDSLSLTALAQDPGNDALSYSWDLGDGSELKTGAAISHNFTAAGTYDLTLTVDDGDGGIDSQTIKVVVSDPNAPQGGLFNLKAEGKVRINGSSDLQGEVLNTLDDTRIYAGKGFTINGNQTLPVLRDDAGNPIQQNGKSVLIDQAITVSPDYNESNAAASKNRYIGIIPPQIIDQLEVTVPEHNALVDAELATRVAPGISPVVFNPQQNPLNNVNDWNNKFPAPGTAGNPTLVNITNGGLNIPSGVDLSHYVIIIENGDLNFNGSGHNLDNVVLINRNGSINLAAIESNDLSILASNTININRNARFGGDTLIAAGNSNSNIHFDGATNTLDSESNLEVISQGNIIFNSSTTTKGNFTAAKNFTSNGRADIIGSIQVKGDITINGGINLRQ